MKNTTNSTEFEFDLEPIVIKLMDDVEGEGWSFKYATNVEQEYRRFLKLCRDYPDTGIVPSNVVDKMWHMHILDTRKYLQDCEQYFGYFLHHFPYFGMRGEEDSQNLDKAWLETKTLYANHFHEKPDANFWQESVRCPSCGRRSTANATNEQRPSYASMGLN
ncbi:MAG: glycine-rich domain-containing protein, partial [Parvibaculales bacterium]